MVVGTGVVLVAMGVDQPPKPVGCLGITEKAAMKPISKLAIAVEVLAV